MSKSNEFDPTALRDAIVKWREIFICFNPIAQCYTTFILECYNQLRAGGMPVKEAAMVAVQLLPMHLQRFLPQDANSTKTQEVADLLLKTWNPGGNSGN